LYATAAVLAGEVEPKAPRIRTSVEGHRWKMRLNNKIARFRKEISTLVEHKGVAGQAVQKKIEQIQKKIVFWQKYNEKVQHKHTG
jgi:hypothetical protein